MRRKKSPGPAGASGGPPKASGGSPTEAATRPEERATVEQEDATNANAGRKSGRKLLKFLGPAVFVGLYVFMAAWFGGNDVWADPSPRGGLFFAAYNFFRVLHLGYFVLLVYSVGSFALYWFERREGPLVATLSDRVVLAFFSGGAVLCLVMLLLGFCRLYYRFTALAITVPFLLPAYHHMRVWLRRFVGRMRTTFAKGDLLSRASYGVLLAAILFTMFFTLVYNAAYPLDHDYVTHYGPYLDEVLRRHDLWPNEVWYQYFYTKGHGTVFLSMLLTDKTAPGLVSCAYLFVSAIALVSLLRRITDDDRWPLAAVAVYLAAFAVSPVDFFKQHIVQAPPWPSPYGH